MSIICWNCHEFGIPWALQFRKEITLQKKPKYFFCEILCKKAAVEKIRRRLGFEGMVSVDTNGHSGGLALLWRNKKEVNLCSFRKNHIDAIVVSNEGLNYRLTGIYGEPDRSKRYETCSLIRSFESNNSNLWCLIGDMNNVLSQSDKRGGNPYPQSLLKGFQDVLNVSDQVDMHLSDYQFTWERGFGSNKHIEVRLDRALVSPSFFNMFKEAKLSKLEVSTSNHSPIWLEPEIRFTVQCKKMFHFENAWLMEPMCYNLVEENEMLLAEIDEKEVKAALFNMHHDKSPGPDGMTPIFYQKCQNIAKSDVTTVIRNFFEIGVLDDELKSTNIAVIPKKPNLERMTDIHPISLCNVVYKIISNVLSNRIKTIIDPLISESQSAFIPDRLITDNIMIAFEVMHYMKWKTKGKDYWMALKLDMSKSYDRVEWCYLEAVVSKLGRKFGNIIHERGLRQCDPLSSYLFLICMEGLSILLHDSEH
ncbi:uncharacterized protein LOC141698585 [Apium graveolens]|uniref:uncharacterized protein LOC141698585 n=1 Tax=Apium graveolens TaxID=4045 RepID=UPI003D7A8202